MMRAPRHRVAAVVDEVGPGVSVCESRCSRVQILGPRELACAVGLQNLAGGGAVTGREGVGDAVQAEGGFEDGGSVDDESAGGEGAAGDADIVRELETVFVVEEFESFIRRVGTKGEDGVGSGGVGVDREVTLDGACAPDDESSGCIEAAGDVQVVAQFEAVFVVQELQGFHW